MKRITASLLLVSFSLLFGCKRELISKVDFPVYLEKLSKTYPDKDYVTVIEKKKDTSSGFRCGHSAICLIFIPFIIWELIFPGYYYDVIVKKNNKEVFHGRYNDSKKIEFGYIIKDDYELKIQLFELNSIQKEVLLETERKYIKDKFTKSLNVFATGNLELIYGEGWTKFSSIDQRTAILDELLNKFKKDSFEYILSLAEKETEKEFLSFSKSFCSDSFHDFELSKKLAEKFLNLGLTESSLKFAKCAKDANPKFIIDPYLNMGTSSICNNDNNQELIQKNLSSLNSLEESRDKVFSLLKDCNLSYRITLIKLSYFEKVSDEELIKSIQKEPFPLLYLSYLQVSNEEQRRLGFITIDIRPELGKEYLLKLSRENIVLSFKEAIKLLEIYSKFSSKESSVQYSILKLLSRFSKDERKELLKECLKNKIGDKQLFATLGDKESLDRLAERIQLKGISPYTLDSKNSFTENEINFSIFLFLGCTEYQSELMIEGIQNRKPYKDCTKIEKDKGN
ncbi:MAG: hypothetical protein SFU98_03740 [Leptospiraceae bacterium]|nr:hypothetical protein [Leptospiraceae bacterium]